MKQYFVACLIGFAITFTSCHEHSQQAEHNHDQAEVLVPYWGYQNGVEVFVDAEPLAFEQSSGLLVHLTNLENFKPLNPAKVTAKLIVGSKGLKQSQQNSIRPGIFRFQFRPDHAGVGYLLIEFEKDGVDHSIRVDGVKVYPDAHEALHLAEADLPNVPGAISFAKEKSWKVDFATAHPVLKPFGKVIKSTAKIEASPEDRMVISAKTSGFVNFAQGLVTPGKVYQRNDLLFQVRGDGISDNNAEVMLKKAEAELEMSKAEYERDKLLAGKQIVSNKEMIQTKARYEKAQSEYNNLTKTIGKEGEKITAPIDGYISEVFVNNGQFVEAGEPVYSMMVDRKLMLTAMVSQSHLADINKVSDLNIEVGDKVVSLSDLNGKLLSVGKSISAHHYLIPVVFETDTQVDLLSGGFANVYLKAKGKEALTVPESALTEEQGVFFVYVQITPELFEKRQVTVGSSDGQLRVILSGLNQEERIVTKGAILVKLASVSNSIDPHAGHVH